MHSKLIPSTLLLIVAAGCGGTCERPPTGAVLATVDGVPIEERRVAEIVDAELLRRGAGQGIDGDELAGIRRAALQLAINGELLVQSARAAGVTVDEAEIEAQVQVARSQFPDDDAFRRHLTDAGSSLEVLRAEVERRLLMERAARAVTDDLEIDEARARELFESEPERYAGDDEVRLAEILVRVAPEADASARAEARERIEAARRALDDGEPFADVASRFSDPALAERGGDLGFVRRGRLLPEIERVAFATPVGATSPVFETPYGWAIVRVLERRASTPVTFEEARTGLMMVLAREQQDLRLREHIAALRQAAEIEILSPELAPRPGDEWSAS